MIDTGPTHQHESEQIVTIMRDGDGDRLVALEQRTDPIASRQFIQLAWIYRHSLHRSSLVRMPSVALVLLDVIDWRG